VDDLLAFSRVGSDALQKTEIDLDELIRKTLGEFQEEAQERNFALKPDQRPFAHSERALHEVKERVKRKQAEAKRKEYSPNFRCFPGGWSRRRKPNAGILPVNSTMK